MVLRAEAAIAESESMVRRWRVFDALTEEAQELLLDLLNPKIGDLDAVMSAQWSHIRESAVVMCGQNCFAIAVRSIVGNKQCRHPG